LSSKYCGQSSCAQHFCFGLSESIADVDDVVVFRQLPNGQTIPARYFLHSSGLNSRPVVVRLDAIRFAREVTKIAQLILQIRAAKCHGIVRRDGAVGSTFIVSLS